MKKLSVRKERSLFKKPSSSLCKARVATVVRKAFELSELCGVDVCIIGYDSEGNLVKTWAENEEAKVRAMAERFSMLSEQERNKKSTNLSRFLNKKMRDEKRVSLRKKDNIFSAKESEVNDSLRSRFQTFQESLLLLDQPPKETTTTTSHVVSTDLSPNTTTTSTSTSLMGGKFSIPLYNHENGAVTELANNVNSSGFEQPSSSSSSSSSCYLQDYDLDLLVGEQQQGMNMMMTSCNNFDVPLPFSNTFQQFDHEFMQQTQPVYHV